MHGRILLNKKIIEKVWETFESHNKGVKHSISLLKDELFQFIDNNKTLFKKTKFYLLDDDFFDIKTLRCAINRGENKDYGGVEVMRNLLCFYAFEYDYITTLEKLGTNVENEKIENDRIKGIDNENEKIQAAKNKYFKYLENECGKVHFEFLHSEGKTIPVIEILENSFVPLSLIELENYQPLLIKLEKYDFQNETRFNIRNKIYEVLLKNKRIAIVANPGCGKSTLINSIALSCAYPERGKQILGSWLEETRFPIFIQCRNFEKKIKDPIIDIINCIPERAEIPDIRKEFEYLVLESLQTKSAFLLIDGLDEIADDSRRKQFTDQLKTFLKTYPDIRVIITSRAHGFREGQGSLSLSQFCSYYVIAPLDFSEIAKLTINWHKIVIEDPEESYKKAKKVYSRIYNDSGIKILAQNPLLLTALLFVNSKEGTLPRKKYILYEKTIKILLSSWNREGHGLEELDYYETVLQLAYVAYMMTSYYSFNTKTIIYEDELYMCLKQAQFLIDRRLDYSISEFIKNVESRTGLLRKSGNESYEFIHSSFQEYFAAIAIVNKYLPKVDLDIKPLDFFKKGRMEEIILFMAPLLSKESFGELISYILNSQCKSITQMDYDLRKEFDLGTLLQDSNKHNTNYDSAIYKFDCVVLLGKLIELELEFDNLLDNVLEWYAKCYMWVSEWENVPDILNCKYSDKFKKKVKYCFFNKYDNDYAFGLINSLKYITILHEGVKKEINLKSFFKKIKNDIRDPNKETKCLGILKLLSNFSFLIPDHFSMSQEDFDKIRYEIYCEIWDIFQELMETTPFDDPHYYYVVAKTIGTLGEDTPYVIDSIEYINLFLNGWLSHTQSSLQYISAYALFGILYPDTVLAASEVTKEKINQKFQNPLHNLDKIVAAYLGIILNINLDQVELMKTINNSMLSPTSFAFYCQLGYKLSDLK